MSMTTCAQTSDKPLKKYAPAALKEDFLLLRETLQEKHPGLYRYKSKEVMDALLDSCYQSIQDSMTIYSFFGIVHFVISAIGDGHAGFALPQSAKDELTKHIRFFPMRLWFTGDKAYVICGRDSFPSGTEIISIDGHPIGEITNRLLDHLPGDGSIRTQKLHVLNDDDDNFSALYYFVYGPRLVFKVEYRIPSGQMGNRDLSADYDKNIKCDVQGEKMHDLALDFKGNGVAVLTIGVFTTKEAKFNRFLQTSFAEISRRQCKALIIDLRNNGGGEERNAATLYSWLTNKPFPYYASLETTKRKYAPEEHPLLKLQQPAVSPFLGEVYFLINGYSFSATAEFCAVARSEKRGVFIGEETGGGYYGNTSGNDTLLVLPNTRISVDISLIKYTLAVRNAEYPDRGVIPEHPIIPGFADWMGHKDVQLEYALRLAGSK